MARKLRPEEALAFNEDSEITASLSEIETLLRDVLEKPNELLDLTTINPAWIKGSSTGPAGS